MATTLAMTHYMQDPRGLSDYLHRKYLSESLYNDYLRTGLQCPNPDNFSMEQSGAFVFEARVPHVSLMWSDAVSINIDPEAAAEAERIAENIKWDILDNFGCVTVDSDIAPYYSCNNKYPNDLVGSSQFRDLKPWLGVAIMNRIPEEEIMSLVSDLYGTENGQNVQDVLNHFTILLALEIAESLHYKYIGMGGISPDMSKFVTDMREYIFNGDVHAVKGDVPDGYSAMYASDDDTIHIRSLNETSLVGLLDAIVHEADHARRDMQGPAYYKVGNFEQFAWERGKKTIILATDFALVDGFADYLNSLPPDYFQDMAVGEFLGQSRTIAFADDCNDCEDSAMVQYEAHQSFLYWLRDIESELYGLPSDPYKEMAFKSFFPVLYGMATSDIVFVDGPSASRP